MNILFSAPSSAASSDTSPHSAPLSLRYGFTPERHQAIHAVKARLKSRDIDACAAHVLYNVLRGLSPRRGFSARLNASAATHFAYLAAAARVPALAGRLGISLDAAMRQALQDACREACVDNARAAGAQGDVAGRAAEFAAAMRHTPHGTASTVADHGIDCALRYARLRSELSGNRLDETAPQWLRDWRTQLLAEQLPPVVMATYLRNHDIGKVTTLVRDELGRPHFPGHAAESARLWRELGGETREATLMELDMVLHTRSAEEAAALIPPDLLPSLLLATYAELLSNAHSIFGGVASDSFKMKLKALNKRATRLCEQRYAVANG